MSYKPSDGRTLFDQVSQTTLLSVTRIAVTATSQSLAALLAAATGVQSTPPYANTNNQLTGAPYTAPYIDEQLREICFVATTSGTLYIGITNAASNGCAAIGLVANSQPYANKLPCNQSVALAMNLKSSAPLAVDVYQFG